MGSRLLRRRRAAPVTSLSDSGESEEGPSGTTSFVFYPALPGGTTFTWTVGGGVSLDRHVSLDGEVAFTGRMSARQPSRYFTMTQERHEVMVTVGVRFQFPISDRVQLEPIVGGLYVTDHGWQQLDYPPPIANSPRSDPPRPLRSSRRLGVSGGLEVRIGNDRIAVVPSFRLLHLFAAYVRDSEKAWTWSARPGVGLRIGF